MITTERSEITELEKKGTATKDTVCMHTAAAAASIAARGIVCQGEGDGVRGGWERLFVTTKSTNLFVNRVTLSEYEVTTEQPRKKGIMRSSLPTVHFLLKDKERLVNRDEFCQIRRVLFRRAQYDSEPLVPANFFFYKWKNKKKRVGEREGRCVSQSEGSVGHGEM
jgi:hypothetical protein